jgi:hypothetical protein
MYGFRCPYPIAHETCTHLFTHPFSEVSSPSGNATKLELTHCSLVLINTNLIHTCFGVHNI